MTTPDSAPAGECECRCSLCHTGSKCPSCHEDSAPAAADKGTAALDIWQEVAVEREWAHHKHGSTSMESLHVTDAVRLTVLVEEVGEVARAFNEARHHGGFTMANLNGLREELIQVAAMAGAWADALPLPVAVSDDHT